MKSVKFAPHINLSPHLLVGAQRKHYPKVVVEMPCVVVLA